MQQLQWWGMPLKIFRKFSKTDALKLLLRLLLAIHTTMTSFVQSHKDTWALKPEVMIHSTTTGKT